jgi:hypothetical protein
MTDAVRRLNATSSGEVLTFEAPEDDLARLDAMPAGLRWRFQESVTKLSTRAFSAHLAWAIQVGRGVRATAAKLAEIEGNEIAVFAGQYRAECRAAYPHIAADASIQRYGALGPSRHPPKRYGKPVVRKQQRGKRRRKHAMVI